MKGPLGPIPVGGVFTRSSGLELHLLPSFIPGFTYAWHYTVQWLLRLIYTPARPLTM